MNQPLVPCAECGQRSVWSLCRQCSALEFELGLRGGEEAACGVDGEEFARRGPKGREPLAVFDQGGPGRVYRVMWALVESRPLDACGEELRVLPDLLPRLELAAELDAWSGGRPCSVRRVYRWETAARR